MKYNKEKKFINFAFKVHMSKGHDIYVWVNCTLQELARDLLIFAFLHKFKKLM